MDLDKAIRNRRSVRKYNDLRVSDEELRLIIQAGTWAPSACNLQQWKFIIINQKRIFEKLYKLGTASFVRDTKQAILVLYNNQTDNVEYNDYIQSAAAAIENMLLKAYSLDIGTCWVNNLPNKRVLRKLMGIPESYDPIALITLGHYTQVLNDRDRKYTLNSQISYNRFEFDELKEKSILEVKGKRYARKIYKRLPFKIIINKWFGKLEKKFDN